MSDLTSELFKGIRPSVAEIRLFGTRVADMNDTQCRLALMWLLSNMATAIPTAEATNGDGKVTPIKGKGEVK